MNSHSGILDKSAVYCVLENNVPPDIVRVPVFMDNDLVGADGNGTRLIVGVQAVFTQVNSVGATSVWPQRTTQALVSPRTDEVSKLTLLSKHRCCS